MKTFVRVAGFNLVLIALGIVIAELIFGDWLSGSEDRLLNIPRSERRTFDVSAFMPGGSVVTYTRDKYGFRGNYGGDPARIDVLVLGGSTANERYVTDSETWVARLQANFHDGGIPLMFANASVDGQSSIGHIAAVDLWLSKIPGLRARYALVYVGINDIAIDPAQARTYDEMKSPEPLRRARQYIINHSALYGLYRAVRGTWRAREARLMHGARYRETVRWLSAKREDAQALRAEFSEPLREYSARLDILTARLRAIGTEPIFITQRRGDFRLRDGSPEVLARFDAPVGSVTDRALRVMELFNEATLASCKRLHLTCVDLTRIELDEADFYDPIHTTPSGSAKIADFLYRELKGALRPRA